MLFGAFVRQSATFDLDPLFSPFGLDLGKLNPDQNVDVVIACNGGVPPGGCGFDDHGGIAVLLGRGNGSFDSTVRRFAVEPLCLPLPRTPKPEFVKIGDLNNDNQNDIVTSNKASHSVSVLINTSQVNPNP